MPRRPLDMWLSEVWNCAHAFEVVCPRSWGGLDETPDASVRWCRACEREVHLCPTPEEFARRGDAGECVAVPHGMKPFTIALGGFLGRPSPDAERRLAEQKAAVRRWWGAVVALAPEFADAELPDLRQVFAPGTSPDAEPGAAADGGGTTAFPDV